MKKHRLPIKVIVAMIRFSCFHLFLLMLTFGVSLAKEGYSQEMLGRKVSIEASGQDIQRVLGSIEKTAKVKFSYEPAILPSEKVTLKTANEPLFSVLEKVLTPLRLHYIVSGNYIILSKSTTTSESNGRQENGTESNSTDRNVKGKVTDEKGVGLPGVNVLIKGTTRGTVSDTEGMYQLTNVDQNATLVFSYVGFVPMEVAVQGNSDVNISLKPDENVLNEMVVVGYGTVKRKDLTGSVASVKREDLERLPVTNINQALQGRVAGVQIRQTQQQPGGSLSVTIRGISSIKGSATPLYVIDGAINGDITMVNPQDIESMEVLKDASATAIYGANGANGVILITTRQGALGKTSVSFDSYVATQQVLRKQDLLSISEYADYYNKVTKTELFDLNNLPKGNDWQDLLYQSGFMQNYNLSLSGGTRKMRYFVSGNFVDQQGVIINTKYGRYNLRANLDSEINDRISFGLRLGVSRDLRNRMDGEGNRNERSPVASALQLPPSVSPYDENGTLLPELEFVTLSEAKVFYSNPIHYSKYLKDETNSTGISGNAFATIELLPGLQFKPSFNFTLSSRKNNFYKPSNIFNTSIGYRNEATVSVSERIAWNSDIILNYNKSFGEEHRINAVGGFIINKSTTQSVNATGRDFALDLFDFHSLSAASTIGSIGSGLSERQQLSYIGRVNYTLKNKYILSVNGRYDGSSIFGVNKKWSFFPSAALAWNLSEEQFIRDLNFFQDLKLRTSYGISGSQALGPYASKSRVSGSQSYIFDGQVVVGYRPSSLPVPDLQWEETAQLDIGLDASILKNRIGFTLDYYEKVTSKLFLDVPLPLTSGVSSITRNTGSLKNTGWEFKVDAAVTQGKLKWNSGINVTFQKQKVLDLGKTNQILLNANLQNFETVQIVKVGEPLGSFYGYRNDGIWQTSELAGLETLPKQFGADVKAGDLKFVDQNGDGDVNPSDRIIVGYALPKAFGGFTNTFAFGGFDASVFMDFVKGNDIFNVDRYSTMRSTNGGRNKLREILNYWTPENGSNTVPRLDYDFNSTAVTDFMMENGSYLRFREITIGYSLQSKSLAKLKMNRCRIYMSAANLFTLTKYSGYNPDVNAFGESSGIFNVDHSAYPSYATFLLGLNIGF